MEIKSSPESVGWYTVWAAVVCLVLCVLGFILWPAVSTPREVPRRVTCRNNLKQIGLALYGYRSAYGSFPPAYLADAQGRPMHSWRVLILPFLGYEEWQGLYNEYDFSEPWDGPKNSKLLARMPWVFACPSDQIGTVGPATNYAALVGDHCVFAGSRSTTIQEISDALSDTIVVGEVLHGNIPWTKPQDVDVDAFLRADGSRGFAKHHPYLNAHNPDGAHFLMADGSVKFFTSGTRPELLSALSTRDGGEHLEDF